MNSSNAESLSLLAEPTRGRLYCYVIEQAPLGRDDEVLDNAARHRGLQVGREPRSRGVRSANGLMALLGYLPVREADGTLRARNCPFYLVAERQLEVTCGMNVSSFPGDAVDGANVKGSVRLEPRPEHCCVAVSPPLN